MNCVASDAGTAHDPSSNVALSSPDAAPAHSPNVATVSTSTAPEPQTFDVVLCGATGQNFVVGCGLSLMITASSGMLLDLHVLISFLSTDTPIFSFLAYEFACLIVIYISSPSVARVQTAFALAMLSCGFLVALVLQVFSWIGFTHVLRDGATDIRHYCTALLILGSFSQGHCLFYVVASWLLYSQRRRMMERTEAVVVVFGGAPTTL